ncbi:MAG TPA: hypothetical protein VH682_31750 [Gemmataceae bacterium]|jgi:hypothetical protein
MNEADNVGAAIHTFRGLLPAWIEGEVQRDSLAEEIARLEGYAREPNTEDHLPWAIRNPELSREERGKLLEQVQESRAKQLAEIREQQRRHDEITAKLAPAVRTLCRFAHRSGIDADPLHRLFDLGELEFREEVLIVLLRIDDALTGDADGQNDERVTFDDGTQTITLDGNPVPVEDQKAYAVYKALYTDYRPGKPVKNATIQRQVKGLNGHNAVSDCIKNLPEALRNTIVSNTNGKSLRFPPLRK